MRRGDPRRTLGGHRSERGIVSRAGCCVGRNLRSVVVTGIAAGDRVCGRRADPSSIGSVPLRRQRVAHDRVRESHPASRLVGNQQVGIEPSPNRVGDLFAGEADHLADDLRIEPGSDDGRGGEHSLRGAVEVADAAAHNGLDTGRHRSHLRCVAVADELDQLAHEERVAIRTGVDRAHEVVASAQPVGDVSLRQRREDDLGDALPRDLGGARDQLRARVGCERSRGGDQESRRRAQLRGEMREHAQRVDVGPLEVVDDENLRTRRRLEPARDLVGGCERDHHSWHPNRADRAGSAARTAGAQHPRDIGPTRPRSPCVRARR